MDFDEIADQQGWSADSEVITLRAFISKQGLDAALAEYAQEVADEENGDDEWSRPVSSA
jgi:hypothetical protein